jgi:carboxylate-amine ligase
MEPQFNGPSYTVGIEEELMILDAETLALANAIEAVLDEYGEGSEVKPELMESVLEIATDPHRSTRGAGEQLRELRRAVNEAAGRRSLCIGSAGTHPFAMPEDQRVSARPRYRDLVSDLRFVARQEVIFGLHVHIGLDDAEKAIHVTNGMRVHVPILLALSANSPFWRAEPTGLASSRMPIFRAFPRVGMPPYYEGWDDYEQRIAFMVDSGVIDDYTFLWYDVRPHPNFGTVEVRAMRLARYPFEMLDENRWLAARHGMDGELVDLPERRRVPAKDLARRLYDRLREHAQDLGSAGELEAIDDIVQHGNGAHRQRVVYEANHDYAEVMREIVEATNMAA